MIFYRVFLIAFRQPLFEKPTKTNENPATLTCRCLWLNKAKETSENLFNLFSVLAKSKQNERVFELVCANGVTPVLIQRIEILR